MRAPKVYRMALLVGVMLLFGMPMQAFTVEESVAPDTRIAIKYIAELQKKQAFAMVSECQAVKPNVPSGIVGEKAVLVFPAGESKGRFMLIQNGKSVVNMGDVELTNGQWTADELLGGPQTIEETVKLIRGLANASFRVVLPQNLGLILSSESDRTCPN